MPSTAVNIPQIQSKRGGSMSSDDFNRTIVAINAALTSLQLQINALRDALKVNSLGV